MKQDIKNNDLRERQTYVPASVKVIELTTQKIICTSTEKYGREEWPTE